MAHRTIAAIREEVTCYRHLGIVEAMTVVATKLLDMPERLEALDWSEARSHEAPQIGVSASPGLARRRSESSR